MMDRAQEYDSDSAESDEYENLESRVEGKTEVLLGYPDELADQTATAFDTRIGGYPIWAIPDCPPSLSLALCANCHGLMSLFVQANASLEGTLYDRVIYVFGCLKPACRRRPGSVRAFRSIFYKLSNMVQSDIIKPDTSQVTSQCVQRPSSSSSSMHNPVLTADLGNAIFGEGFGTNAIALPEAKQVSGKSDTKLQQDSIADVTEKLRSTFIHLPELPISPWPTLTNTSHFKSYFLYVENEYLSKVENLDLSQRIQIVDTNDQSIGTESSSIEALPESDAGILDITFQKFADTVAMNPEQVIRYQRKGSPLFYSSTDGTYRKLCRSNSKYDSSNIPSCPLCHAERIFELQLMPYLIQILEEDQADIENGMEWGTILVATCEADCTPQFDNEQDVWYMEEWVGVQWEEKS
ncbi:programmed cell death protein 2 [Lipomyces oligophaga]|uniref:programmed cell death protein 2 n=1 Tax=Lipomyces oligophaga TaxID=45792 RepID=UPI0034CE74B6